MNMNPTHALVLLQEQVYWLGRRQRPVSELMTWLLDRRNLEAAWRKVVSSNGADTPGVDGVTVRSVGGSIESWLAKLADDLRRGSWAPSPARCVEIPKANGDVRVLGILTVRDRVAHTALKQVLEPLLEPRFNDDSFGFRPGRCVAGALDRALLLINGATPSARPFTVAARLDVAKCFDTIDHGLLRQRMMSFVDDESFLSLVDQLLGASGQVVGSLWARSRRGLTQGSSLSPLLCNLALDRVDEAIECVKPRVTGGVRLLRYADDLLLLAHDKRSLHAGLRQLRGALRSLRQSDEAGKRRIAPVEKGLEWLGVEFRRCSDPWPHRFGYFIPERRVRKMLERIDAMTLPPDARLDPSAFNPGRWIASLNEQLREWRTAYQFAENALGAFRAVDGHADKRVGNLLAALTGRRLRRVVQDHRVKLPRGFFSWQFEGQRLLVLSSLPPKAPLLLTKKPSWMGNRTRRRQAKTVGSNATRPLPTSRASTT